MRAFFWKNWVYARRRPVFWGGVVSAPIGVIGMCWVWPHGEGLFEVAVASAVLFSLFLSWPLWNVEDIVTFEALLVTPAPRVARIIGGFALPCSCLYVWALLPAVCIDSVNGNATIWDAVPVGFGLFASAALGLASTLQFSAFARWVQWGQLLLTGSSIVLLAGWIGGSFSQFGVAQVLGCVFGGCVLFVVVGLVLTPRSISVRRLSDIANRCDGNFFS